MPTDPQPPQTEPPPLTFSQMWNLTATHRLARALHNARVLSDRDYSLFLYPDPVTVARAMEELRRT